MENTTAIVLAAGLSRRMGRNKMLLPYRGKALLQHCLDLVASLPFSRRVLVTTGAVADKLSTDGFVVVENPAPELGQSGSVALGTQAAKAGQDLLFFPGDQPLLDRETVNLLFAGVRGGIVYPLGPGGAPSSPVLFGARFREELLQLTGDEGGRTVRRAHPGACRGVAVPVPGVLRDIDTLADYRALTGQADG